MPATWDVFAICYASAQRMARDNFVDVGGIADRPMPIDFYVWLLRSADRCILVDTGFNGAAATRRDRHLARDPIAAARSLCPSGRIDDVVLTHLHYDHAGNLGALPEARLHVQAREMAFVSGAPMRDERQRHFFEADDVAAAIHRLHQQRMILHDGDAGIADGVSVHLIGGHTAGLQAVRIRTARGWVVLASDASHFYANLKLANPFPAIWNRNDMIAGYARLRDLADSEDHIVPGHDPLVQRFYSAPGGAAGGDIVALHMPPSGRLDLATLLGPA